MRAALLLSFFAAQGFAAEFTAKIDLDKPQATLFEKVHVRLSLAYPKGYEVDPGALENSLMESAGFGIPPFQIAQADRKTEEKGDEIVDTFSYTLEPQTLGKKTLTFWKIAFKPPAGKEESSLFTDWVAVEILPPKEEVKEPLVAPLMDLTERFPIDLTAASRYQLAELEKQEPSRNLDNFGKRKLAWLGWLALALGALFLWRFRSPRQEVGREAEKIAARQQLQKSLKELQASIKAGNLEDFYARLVSHLRIYYEQFYGRKINALTTEEFLSQAPPGMRSALKGILEIGDQVRFGHLPASKENAQTALDIATKDLSSF